MPVVPVLKYEVSVAVDILRVTDITGEYDASDNVNGWGAPNAELDLSALFFIVKRKASTEDEFMESVTTQVVYDAAAANTKETAVEFTYLNDGVLEVTVGVLPYSADGTSIPSGAIPNDTFFYWSNSGETVWKMVDSVPVAVTDINDLLDEADTVIQTTEQDILLPKLAVQKQSLYKTYRMERDKKCGDAKKTFQELLELGQNIQGAVYAFYSGLTTEAQDQVETLLEEYQLN